MKDRHQIDREMYKRIIYENDVTWSYFQELQDKVELKSDDRVYVTEDIKYNADYEDDRWIELSVWRYTPETGEEYYKRIGEEELEMQAREARMKEIRRKKYLELKEEFENESI